MKFPTINRLNINIIDEFNIFIIFMCLSDELERQRDFYEEQGLEMPSSLQSKSENRNSHDNVTSTSSGHTNDALPTLLVTLKIKGSLMNY